MTLTIRAFSAGLVLLSILGTAATALQAQGDAQAGKAVFDAQCARCHGSSADQKRAGPHLVGVVGRRAGVVQGFASSSALKNANIVWSEATLDSYLADPAKIVPGTTKTLGLSEQKQRADVIEYLKTLT